MSGIKVGENEPFENALRRFKKQCEKAGILSEARKRQYFEKPSIKRKKKAVAARKRAVRLANSVNGNNVRRAFDHQVT